MMGVVVTFYFYVVSPQTEHPLTFKQNMASMEECIGTAAVFLQEARRSQPQGVYQAGCSIEIPQTEVH